MKCSECGNEMKKGIVEAKNAGSITNSLTLMSWYPEEYKGRMIKKHTVDFRLNAEGYYCDECMKVYAIFEER